MSVYVMSWVWKHGPKDATERLVLLAIADHADDQGRAFPSMEGIAEKSCLTARGARGVIRRLEASGWLSTRVGGGRGGKSHYTINMNENPEQETGNDKPGKGNAECETRNVNAQNPERDDTKPGTRVPPNHQGTIKEPSKRASEEKIVQILSQHIDADIAQAFFDHRKAMKKPLTEKAAEIISNKLAGRPDAAAIIETSIMNGWQGIFPERQDGRAANVTSFPSKSDEQRRRWARY